MLIAFEGPDGAGKTTQAKLLAQRLVAEGFQVVEVREPGGTALGEEIRHILKAPRPPGQLLPLPELYLFCAARAQLVQQVIRPALQRGDVVIADRFLMSTIAYQGHGRQLAKDEEGFWGIIMPAIGPTNDSEHHVIPDITFYVTVPREVAKARGRGPQANDRLDAEADSFHRRVNEGFETLARNDRDAIVHITGIGDIMEIADRIYSIARKILDKK